MAAPLSPVPICAFFMCGVCGASFSSKKNAKRHFKRFHAPKEELPRVDCPGCEKSFAKRSYMNRHFKRFHAIPTASPTGEELPREEPVLIEKSSPSGIELPIEKRDDWIVEPSGEELLAETQEEVTLTEPSRDD